MTPPKVASTTRWWRSSWWQSAARGCCCHTTCCAAAWLWSPCSVPAFIWATTSAWPPSPTSSAARYVSGCSSTTPASLKGFSVSSSLWESSLCSGNYCCFYITHECLWCSHYWKYDWHHCYEDIYNNLCTWVSFLPFIFLSNPSLLVFYSFPLLSFISWVLFTFFPPLFFLFHFTAFLYCIPFFCIFILCSSPVNDSRTINSKRISTKI